jgi:hypothetical protein
MMLPYLAVTDLELLASQVVKILAIVILVVAAGIHIKKSLRAHSLKYRVGRIIISITLLVISILILKWVIIDGSLLNSEQYAIGTTIGLCQVFVRGQGVAFEYEIENHTYRNCNTSHPILISDINVSGGRYYVRYSTNYPGEGRIDFTKTVE